MSKTIIAVKHFTLGGRKSLETAVIELKFLWSGPNTCFHYEEKYAQNSIYIIIAPATINL